MNAFPALLTQRLLLREIDAADIHHVFEGLSHPDVIRFYGVSYESLESTQQQMKWFNDLRVESSGIWWAVCDRSTNAFLGAAGFNNIDQQHQSAEIGFWLLPEYWGKGYIPEAVQAILPYAFDVLQLQSIEALVETGNKNSSAVLQKLNFDYIDTDVNCEIKNGRPISLIKYALTATNFEKARTQ